MVYTLFNAWNKNGLGIIVICTGKLGRPIIIEKLKNNNYCKSKSIIGTYMFFPVSTLLRKDTYLITIDPV